MRSSRIIRWFGAAQKRRVSASIADLPVDTGLPTIEADAAAECPEGYRTVEPMGGFNGESGLQLKSFDSAEWWDGVTRVFQLPVSGAPLQLYSGVMQPYSAEQYRIIRTGIVRALQRPFLLAVSSPGVGDGKTFNAINLAAALALTGEGRTLLIDTDLRGASVHKHLRIDQSPGLAEVLSGSSQLHSAIVRFKELPALHVLPAGASIANPTDQFDSPAWNELVKVVRRCFAHVVLDCPPVNLFGDYDLIAAVCDGVLAVVRPGHTNRTLCMAALAKLRPRLTGVVINGAKDWFLWKKSTLKYYSRYYSDSKEHRSRRLRSAR